jgi:hypothetical protein
MDIFQPISLTAATVALTKTNHAGTVLVANRAAGITATLPAATGGGATYEIVVGTTITSNNLIIQAANASDVMAGVAVSAADGGDTAVAFETAADTDTITLNGSTKGGIKGDRVLLKDVAANLWHVTVIGSATGSEVTPFSAAV